MEYEPPSRQQRGNALFLILIAVALFAVLIYAITEDSRSAGSGTGVENATLMAGQITEMPAAIRQMVTRMIVEGTPATSITFTGTATSTDVFYSGGGGVTIVPPPVNACSPACTAWEYLTFTTPSSGFYVGGVGTSATDALAYLPNVTQQVCQQIQKGLGFTTWVTPPVQNTAAFNPATPGIYAGDNTGSATTISDGPGGVLLSQEFSCFSNLASGYAYYHVLIVQ